MTSRLTNIITGLVGLLLMASFVIGLSHTISTGFAGFWGGLPFVIIIVIVLTMAGYDFWDVCIRKKDDDEKRDEL